MTDTTTPAQRVQAFLDLRVEELGDVIASIQRYSGKGYPQVEARLFASDLRALLAAAPSTGDAPTGPNCGITGHANGCPRLLLDDPARRRELLDQYDAVMDARAAARVAPHSHGLRPVPHDPITGSEPNPFAPAPVEGSDSEDCARCCGAGRVHITATRPGAATQTGPCPDCAPVEGRAGDAPTCTCGPVPSRRGHRAGCPLSFVVARPAPVEGGDSPTGTDEAWGEDARAHVRALLDADRVVEGGDSAPTRRCFRCKGDVIDNACDCAYWPRPVSTGDTEPDVPDSARLFCGKTQPHSGHDWTKQTGSVDFDTYWCGGRAEAVQ